MKLTIGIVFLGIACSAFGQTANIIESTRTKLNTVEQQKSADLNAVLPGVQRSSAKPSAVKMGNPVHNAVPATSKPVVANDPQKPKTGTSTPTVAKSATTPVKSAPKSTLAKAVEAKT